MKPEGSGGEGNEVRCMQNRDGPHSVVRGKPDERLLRTELTEYTTGNSIFYYSVQSLIK